MSVVVRAVAAGEEHVCVVDTDGVLWGTGSNLDHQLGDVSVEDVPVFTRLLDDVDSVWCGPESTVVRKTNGSLWGCGHNSNEMFLPYVNASAPSAGSPSHAKSFVELAQFRGVDVVEVAVNRQLVVRDVDGVLHSRSASPAQPHRMLQLHAATRAVSVGVGARHVAVVDDAMSLRGAGSNELWQLGGAVNVEPRDPNELFDTPAVRLCSGRFTDVVCAEHVTVARDTSGELWWSGRLGFLSSTDQRGFAAVDGLSGVTCFDVGDRHIVACDADGSVWLVGERNHCEAVGATDPFADLVCVAGVDAVDVAASASHSFVVTASGELLVAGFNDDLDDAVGVAGCGTSGAASFQRVEVGSRCARLAAELGSASTDVDTAYMLARAAHTA